MNGREICPGVWHFEEDYRVYCTLLQGKDRAILWDTGQGKQDLAAYVASRLSTPCLVLNSHGHSDHVGGNFRFPLVYAPPLDWPLIQAQSRMTERDCALTPLEVGAVFDLGGLRAQVVSLAGHTQGSVGLLLEEERLLLAGDGLNPTLLLLGREAAPLPQLRRSCPSTATSPATARTPWGSPRWSSICATWTICAPNRPPIRAPTDQGSAGASTGNQTAGP